MKIRKIGLIASLLLIATSIIQPFTKNISFLIMIYSVAIVSSLIITVIEWKGSRKASKLIKIFDDPYKGVYVLGSVTVILVICATLRLLLMIKS